MITKAQALTARNFEHASLKGSDKKPIRCRANGKCQVWSTRPNDFKLPVKHGMHITFYLTHENAHEWVAVS
jgi:hypothetical protein